MSVTVHTPASVRFQVLSIFACYGVAGFYWGTYVATLPALQVIAGLDNAAFGWLLTMMTVGGIISMQLMGRVLHRVQAVAIPLSLLGFAVGMVILGWARGPIGLGFALFCAGAASGVLDISLNMRVARIEHDFGLRLFNRVHALFPFSMLVTSAAVGVFREWGATPALLFPAAATFLVIAAGGEWLAGRHQRPGPDQSKGEGRVRFGGVLMALGALAALGAIMDGGAGTWSALFVEGPLGGSPILSGLAAASVTLGLTTGRLIAHQLEHSVRDMVIIRSTSLLVIPFFVALSFAQVPLVAIGLLFVAGVCLGPIEPAVYRSVSKRFPETQRGRALALATGLAYVGFLGSPPLMGALIQGFGWPMMWLSLCVFAVAASFLAARIPAANKP
ncbi:MAG: MFS transporter [Rhodobacterales bacterium]|nr:MFS transporter [Rhodobacterales bacterium]